ncbi:uncharacterized protein LOC143034514 isoform X2 [Oratosquilla oratoria]|uniref:uncharacterized protein LOC143034514 isoform X2 n=1 Tax=Oratosquilla oratoria TaxID=337810 RepID=UPI003F76113E
MDKLWQTTALMTMMVLMLGVGPSAQDQSPSKTRANTDCLDGIPGFDIFLFKFCEEVCPWTTMESICPPDTITPCPSHTPTTTSACDESFSVDNSVKGNIQRKWSSPNYPNNYTDGCNCTLTVNITGAANIHIGFANSSKIYDDSGCMHDRLLFDGSFAWVVCGSKIDQLSRNFSRVHNDMYFTATFVSDSGDGNKVATGFEMMLKVHIP